MCVCVCLCGWCVCVCVYVCVSCSLIDDPGSAALQVGRPSNRSPTVEIETKLRFLVQAVGRRANRTAADFIQGIRDWQEFRLGKITGTLARAVRVDGGQGLSTRLHNLLPFVTTY